MKNLLVLAGGSKRNEAWGIACAEYFKDDFDMTYFIHYDHWSTGESNIDWEAEIEKIAATFLSSDDSDVFYVYAKSIGSILTLKAIEEGVIAPKQCVFFGMPLDVVADSVFKDDGSLLTDFTVPTLAFHNIADPTAEYNYVKEKLNIHNNSITLQPLEGNTHDYLDFPAYKNTIEAFINS